MKFRDEFKDEFKDEEINNEVNEIFGLFTTDTIRNNVIKNLQMTVSKIKPGLTMVYDFKKAVTKLQSKAKSSEKKLYGNVLDIISDAIRSGNDKQIRRETLCKNIKKAIAP